MVNYDKLPADSNFFDGQLYQTMNEDLQLAGMSKRTVHGYLRRPTTCRLGEIQA